MIVLSRFMQLDLPQMMEFIYWIFIQIRPPHAMWTSKLLLFYHFVFGLFTYHFLPGHIIFYQTHLIASYLQSFPLLISTYQRGNKRPRGKSTCGKQACPFIPKGAFLCSPSTQPHHNCRYTGWFPIFHGKVLIHNLIVQVSTVKT